MGKRNDNMCNKSGGNSIQLPLVGTKEWHSLLTTLVTKLGRGLTKKERKHLVRLSCKTHDGTLKVGRMNTQRLYARPIHSKLKGNRST